MTGRLLDLIGLFHCFRPRITTNLMQYITHFLHWLIEVSEFTCDWGLLSHCLVKFALLIPFVASLILESARDRWVKFDSYFPEKKVYEKNLLCKVYLKCFYIDFSGMSGKKAIGEPRVRKGLTNCVSYLQKKNACFSALKWFCEIRGYGFAAAIRINAEWEMLCAIFHYRVKNENPYLSIF